MPVSALVFVHSPFVAPVTWRGVADELAADGFTAAVPDIRGALDVHTIAAAIAAEIPAGVTSTVLIGHSGVGPLLPAIAEVLGTTTALVYVDAGLPRPGIAWTEEAPTDLVQQLATTVDDEGLLPPWHEWFPADAIAEVLSDPAARAAFIEGIPRLPWSFLTEPGPSADWTGLQSYLLLSGGYVVDADRMRAAGHPVVELDADHLAPFTRPGEVAAAIRELVDQPRAAVRFGQFAESYDAARPEYPEKLVAAALAYAGDPSAAVEVGAGTGIATEAFVARGIQVTCVEPDAGMATVLRARFADRPQVTVVGQRFEQWTPPAGGVGLLYFALSWHWAEPDRRTGLAAAALRPVGTLALLSNHHGFADEGIEAELNAIYDQVAPDLRARPKVIEADVVEVQTRELHGCGLFRDIESYQVVKDHPYPTHRYLDLLRSFSPHIALASARRRILHDRIGAAIDAAGGTLVVRLTTSLVLARRDR